MNKKIVNLKKLNEMTLIKPVGLCWGGFDLLHSGHIMHFKFAKKYCKTLIVAINSDKCFPHKGRNRPFLRENTRLNILSSISEINYTLIYRGKYPRASESKGFLHGKILSTPFIPLEIFEKIQPDLYFKGYEYCGKKIPELKYLSTYGGRIMFGPKKNIFSSSKIIKSNKKYL